MIKRTTYEYDFQAKDEMSKADILHMLSVLGDYLDGGYVEIEHEVTLEGRITAKVYTVENL